MPLHRRLPKRGFNKRDRKIFNEVPLGRLQAAVDASLIDAGKPVDAAALIAAGVIRRALDGVRILGGGELKAKLALTVNHATAGAKAAIEGAGGSITLIEKKVLPADEAKRKKSADCDESRNPDAALYTWGTRAERLGRVGFSFRVPQPAYLPAPPHARPEG